MTRKELQIENRKQRVESLKNDYQIMDLVEENIRLVPEYAKMRQLLQNRMHDNMLDRMLILKEIEIISQQP